MSKKTALKGVQLEIWKGGYICSDCALANDGKWGGHAATCHTNNCMICREEKSLACTTDWDFPFFKLKYGQREDDI